MQIRHLHGIYMCSPLFHRSCNSLHSKQEKLSASLSESPPYTVAVHRNGVRQRLLQLYKLEACQDLLDRSLSVQFIGERADDLSGVTRELFSIFFREVKDAYFEGCTQMAPRVDPQTCDSDGTLFATLGRIASHCFVVTGIFPIFIAQASVHSALLPSEPVPEQVLMTSFMKYVDDFEREPLQKLLDGKELNEEEHDIVVCVLSRCQCFQIPNITNIRDIVISMSLSELVCRPAHALQAFARGMTAAHPDLWCALSSTDVDSIYTNLIPTCRSVWQSVLLPGDLSRQEDKVADFLRRFIFSLDQQKLSLFLRFITGSSCMTTQIFVDFNSQCGGFARRPTSTACSNALHLPSTYATYAEFRYEFSNVLNNSDLWYMDAQ